ncbi:hypothetical protein F5Y13DRAFT_64130 [Hypoxylon sp. FL1857]|nr:hypothetical protein F5Y13DRAFT_64130 [Hypoxylon sp. FL1857]
MQFSAITTLFALAAVATAAPAEVEVRTGGNPTPTCANEQPNQVCCSGILGLNCVLSIIGQECGGTAYCCNNQAVSPSGGLIVANLNLLNCVSLL